MKRILFDLTKTQQTSDGKFHGGGKYGIEVFKKLVELSPEKVAAYYNNNLYVNTEVLHLIKQFNIPTYFSNNISIIDASKEEGSFIYSPLYDMKYTLDKSVRIYVTLHGVRDLVLLSDKYQYSYGGRHGIGEHCKAFLKSHLVKYGNKKRLERAKTKYLSILENEQVKYITVSNHSKYAILASFPQIMPEQINVYYSPSTICNLPIKNIFSKYGKYWLVVSGNRWIKNAIRAIIAFDQLFSERSSLQGKVVITGIKSLNELSVKISNTDRFICVGYVDEEELKSLYHYAYALVYPTLDEGFGYPPIEAMYEKCPVIGSAVASIPEVCGDSILYFNPYSIAEIKMRILQFEDEKVRNTFIERGVKRQQFIQQRQEQDLKDFCVFLINQL